MTTTAGGSPDTAAPDPAGRLAAVHRYEILDAPTDGAFDDVARMAALIFGTPIATVSIVDTDRVWFAATHGLDGVTEIGAEPGLCASAILGEDPYVVCDAAIDPRTLDNPLVRGEQGLRFYAAAPIVTTDGHRLGTVNVIDREPREVSDTQTTLLTHLAAVVARHLELRLATIEAVRSERVLRDEADGRVTEAIELAARLRAAASAQRDDTPEQRCQLGSRSRPCAEPAELKIADAWGDAAWGCVEHVEVALTSVSGVFLADRDQAAVLGFVDRA